MRRRLVALGALSAGTALLPSRTGPPAAAQRVEPARGGARDVETSSIQVDADGRVLFSSSSVVIPPPPGTTPPPLPPLR